MFVKKLFVKKQDWINLIFATKQKLRALMSLTMEPGSIHEKSTEDLYKMADFAGVAAECCLRIADEAHLLLRSRGETHRVVEAPSRTKTGGAE